MIANIAQIVLIVSLCVWLWVTRKPHTSDRHSPQTAEQRIYGWNQRLDAAIGTDSEERLRLQASGTAAKRRMLAECRNRSGKALERIARATKPEASEPVQVTVRRQRLRLARGGA